MFYFLVLLGGGFIFLGLQKRKKELNLKNMPLETRVADERDQPVDASGFRELNDRIDQLQRLVFESLMAKEEHKLGEKTEIFEEKATRLEEKIPIPEEVKKPLYGRNKKEVKLPETKPIPENVKAILEYEKQGLSVQEIANQTHMDKGEVLLLQNLAKHYAK